MIEELPERQGCIPVLNTIQKEFYFKVLEYRYENILLPTYKKLIEKN